MDKVWKILSSVAEAAALTTELLAKAIANTWTDYSRKHKVKAALLSPFITLLLAALGISYSVFTAAGGVLDPDATGVAKVVRKGFGAGAGVVGYLIGDLFKPAFWQAQADTVKKVLEVTGVDKILGWLHQGFIEPLKLTNNPVEVLAAMARHAGSFIGDVAKTGWSNFKTILTPVTAFISWLNNKGIIGGAGSEKPGLTDYIIGKLGGKDDYISRLETHIINNFFSSEAMTFLKQDILGANLGARDTRFGNIYRFLVSASGG